MNIFWEKVPKYSVNGGTSHHHHHCQCHQLQTILARVLDELRPKRKHFYNLTDKISSEQVRKVEKSNRLVKEELKKIKEMPYFDHFSCPGESDPYVPICPRMPILGQNWPFNCCKMFYF